MSYKNRRDGLSAEVENLRRELASLGEQLAIGSAGGPLPSNTPCDTLTYPACDTLIQVIDDHQTHATVE